MLVYIDPLDVIGLGDLLDLGVERLVLWLKLVFCEESLAPELDCRMEGKSSLWLRAFRLVNGRCLLVRLGFLAKSG